MRDFRRPPGALDRLAPGTRALYAAFLLFMLAGMATSLALYWDGMGWRPKEAASYILGNADDPDATAILVGRSARELLEQTHFHVYTMPLVLLVLGHLFLLVNGAQWRRWVVGGAVAATALHLAAPWAVYLGGPAWGAAMPATALPFVVLYLVLVLEPLAHLLRPARRSPGV